MDPAGNHTFSLVRTGGRFNGTRSGSGPARTAIKWVAVTTPAPPPAADPAPPDDLDDSRFRAAIAGIMADLRGRPSGDPPATPDPGSAC